MDWHDLPELALIQVLNYLPLQDQLNARLVCRYWKLITDSSARRDELVLFLEIYPRPVYWFHDGREVDLGDAFLVTDLDSMKSELFLRHFRRIRKLMIVHVVNTPSKQLVEQIQASFHELEHLQFNSLGNKVCFSGLRRLVYETDFNLPNLRTFYSQAGDIPLGLHCPKLTELYVYSHLTISKTTDDQTKLCLQNLRFLLVEQLTYPSGFKFSNLEVFYFNQPSLSIDLSDFPRLKELHYFDGFSRIPHRLKETLESFFEQKRSLKRDQLSIYFDGFELNDRDDFETLNSFLDPDRVLYALDLNERLLPLIKEEGQSICKFDLLSKTLPVNDSVDDELIGLPEEDALVESMLKSATQVAFEIPLSEKPLNFFDLFDRFRYVCCVIISVELSQALLDRLPDALPHLVDFSYHPKLFGNHFLSFEFLARFKSLYSFLVHRRLISIDEFRLILEKCKFIRLVVFNRPNNAGIRMFRPIGQKMFQVKWSSSDYVEFARATFTRGELLDYLEASRWLEKNDFLGERKDEGTRNYLFLRQD